MEKKEIKEEILSKMDIKIKDTLFYLPGEIIKGEVKIYPGFKFNMKNKKLNLKMKILQYEFWECKDIKIDELKNVNKTEIQIDYFEHFLKEEERANYNEKINVEGFSMIFIEKEEKKEITIPFEFKLIENGDKLLPTFQYENEKYILGIRHLLTVECDEYNSKNYIGLFIGKKPNPKFIEKKEINSSFLYGLNIIKFNLFLPKTSFSFQEEIRYKIANNLKYIFKFLHDCKFEHNIFRKIEWIGYLKNTLLDKKLMKQVEQNYQNVKDNPKQYDEDECEGECWSFLFGGILGGITGSIYSIATAGLLAAPLGGFTCLVAGAFGSVFLFNLEPGNVSCEAPSSYKMLEGEDKKEQNKSENDIKEFISKFVYFKEDKIIGFIKFKEDITPPVNGYYFKCNYNLKIYVKMDEEFTLSQQKEIKSEIDFYDGKEYVEKMKKIFSI